MGGLRTLDEILRAMKGRLIVRRGDPPDELASLFAETGACAIFAEEDHSPYARERDARVARRLPLHLVSGRCVNPPGTVLRANGSPYVVFTPFSRAWKALPLPVAADLLPAPRELAVPPTIGSLPVPSDSTPAGVGPFPPGEAEAQRRPDAFAGGDEPPVYRYGTAPIASTWRGPRASLPTCASGCYRCVGLWGRI